jgi:hypothetical protein
MPTMQLDRPIDEILAAGMPPNRPSGPGGDSPGTESAEPETERDDDEEDEAGSA